MQNPGDVIAQVVKFVGREQRRQARAGKGAVQYLDNPARPGLHDGDAVS
jgi:hypothetical protein